MNLAELPDRIRAVAQTMESADPDDVVDQVSSELSSTERLSIFNYLFTRYVKDVLRGGRGTVSASPRDTSTRSPKWARAAAWYANYRVSIDGEWRFLKTLEPDDCDAVARERRALAAQNVAVAEKFEKLAALMRERGAAVVDDLDIGDVAEIFE